MSDGNRIAVVRKCLSLCIGGSQESESNVLTRNRVSVLDRTSARSHVGVIEAVYYSSIR